MADQQGSDEAARWCRRPGMPWRWFRGTVLVADVDGAYRSLGGVAAPIWALLDVARTEAELTAELAGLLGDAESLGGAQVTGDSGTGAVTEVGEGRPVPGPTDSSGGVVDLGSLVRDALRDLAALDLVVDAARTGGAEGGGASGTGVDGRVAVAGRAGGAGRPTGRDGALR